jgi:hypothetical protein
VPTDVLADHDGLTRSIEGDGGVDPTGALEQPLHTAHPLFKRACRSAIDTDPHKPHDDVVAVNRG